MIRLLLVLALFVLSLSALGEEIEIDSTGFYVPMNEPEWVELGNSREAYPGYQRHITATGKNGTTESHWCYGTNVGEVSEDDFDFEFGAGYCTVVDEDGDAYWTWFEVDGQGAFTWKVMDGIGKYKGATGDGISTSTKVMPDGTAELSIKGKIELADGAE